MTENEAIEIIKYASAFNNDNSPLTKALEVANQALEEIQQYRAIGTVEDIYNMLEVLNRTISELHSEVDKYRAIGTIEEFKAFKEKNEPKKAKWHPNPCAEDNRIPICPNCNTIMVRTEIFGRTIDEHCVSCGQAIDWSE